MGWYSSHCAGLEPIVLKAGTARKGPHYPETVPTAGERFSTGKGREGVSKFPSVTQGFAFPRSSTLRIWRTRSMSCCRSLRRRVAGPFCTLSASTEPLMDRACPDLHSRLWSHFFNVFSLLIFVYTPRCTSPMYCTYGMRSTQKCQIEIHCF